MVIPPPISDRGDLQLTEPASVMPQDARSRPGAYPMYPLFKTN
jgi:hypothetical protein